MSSFLDVLCKVGLGLELAWGIEGASKGLQWGIDAPYCVRTGFDLDLDLDLQSKSL
jgi:hypothetical protein